MPLACAGHGSVVMVTAAMGFAAAADALASLLQGALPSRGRAACGLRGLGSVIRPAAGSRCGLVRT